MPAPLDRRYLHFPMRVARICAALAVMAAVFSAVAAAAASQAPRAYILPERMEAMLTKAGLTWAGRNHAVLDVNCAGKGLPGPKRLNQSGFKSATYHRYLCTVSMRRPPLINVIRVEVRSRTQFAWEDIS